MTSPKQLPPDKLVAYYLNQNYRCVFWPTIGDQKGPREKDWPTAAYPLEAFRPGMRVGLMTGVEISPGRHLSDIDIDWPGGIDIAIKLLPTTEFVYGRAGKRVSHCFYTTNEPLASFKFEDVDKTTLIEIRGTKTDGSIGLQSMAPPSVWEDKTDAHREPLEFVRDGSPAHIAALVLKVAVTHAAIAMLLARHLGTRGFTHEVRLAYAGTLLRLGLDVEDVVRIGEAILGYTKNQDTQDIRMTVESTARRLTDVREKVKGGPALAKSLGPLGKKVVDRIHEWLGREQDFLRNGEGVILRDSLENVRRAVELCEVELSYNEFSDVLLIGGQPLQDRQLSDLWFRIDSEFHFRPTAEFFEKSIKHLAWKNGFHPVKIYLDGLVWDGIPRVNTWLRDYAGAEDSEYLQAVSSIFLMAAVRRIDEPGCKYDEMLVLESGQGVEKSTTLATLCPDKAWFCDDLPLNVSSQRLIEGTLGKWIVEAADMAGKRKAEIEQLKAMLSRQVDGPARMAYARLPVERARQFVLVGTTNSQTYLTDPTGNRRFWPVEVSDLNIKGLRTVRDQLWAEAAHRSRGGESIRLPKSLWAEAGRRQDARRERDAWEEPIMRLLAAAGATSTGRVRVITSDIWDFLQIEIPRRDRYGSIRISEIMQRLGYKSKRLWHEGKTVVGYEGPQVSLDFEK